MAREQRKPDVYKYWVNNHTGHSTHPKMAFEPKVVVDLITAEEEDEEQEVEAEAEAEAEEEVAPPEEGAELRANEEDVDESIYGICQECEGSCNPASQMCGMCARNLSRGFWDT
jgi:hypothetical protein